MKQDQEILAFCHIVKAAGTTFGDILKSNFGVRHLNVEPYKGTECYSARNLRRDLRAMPWLRSLAGHGLRPHIDYAEHADRLLWLTWLRDPVARLISGYQHGVEKNGLQISFEQMLIEPGHKNRQVLFISGSDTDLDGAKEILSNKFRFVGFVEDFNTGLHQLAKAVPQCNLDIVYPKPSNTAIAGDTAKRIRENLHRYRDLLEENTELDQKLYEWAREQFNTGADQTGGTAQTEAYTEWPGKRKIQANYLFRHLVYKPLLSRL